MLRRLSVALALGLLAVAGSVQALGLGTIKVDSALNQRFSAVIPFTSLTAEEAANVRARIADNQDFDRAGMDRAAAMSSIRMEVAADGPNPRVILRSTEIMREPLVNLLIEVRTTGGPRILRQFTVLLDPPGNAAPAPLPAPSGEAGQGEAFFQTAEESSASAVVAAPRPAAPAPRAQPVDADGRYGPIRAGETLSTVAQSVRPEGVSVEQAMLSLFESNRSAFQNADINRLSRGATLDVPSADQMREASTSAARARIQSLQAASNEGTKAATPAPATSAAAPAPEVVPKVEASLPAVPAVDSASLPAASAAAPSAEQRAKPEGGPATSTEPSAATAPDAEAGEALGVDTLGQVPPAAAAEESRPGTAAPATPAVEQPAASEPAQRDWISNYLLPGLIGFIVLMIGFAAWRTARERKAQREYEDAARNPAPMPAPRPGAAGSVGGKATATTARDELEALNRRIEDEDATRVQSGGAGDDDATRVTPAPNAEQARMVTTSRIPPYTGPQAVDRKLSDDEQAVSNQFASSTQAINLGDNDPIAESEFHLAYGLYEEAALLLQQASARDPQRTDLRVKLAETYFAAGKAKEFEQTAATLKGQVAPEEWNKIAIMGRQIAPGLALFAGAADVGDTALDLSLDDDTTQIAPVKVDEGLEFNLEELELPTPVASKPNSPAHDVIEFDLGEFNLGDDDQTRLAGMPRPMDLSLADIDLQVLDDPLGDEALGSGNDAATKLDLARAYVEMGDSETARSLLDEVAQVGNEEQKREAGELRGRLLG